MLFVTNSMTDCCSKIILLQISTVLMLTKALCFSIVKIAENRLFSFQSGDFTTKALPPNFHANIAEKVQRQSILQKKFDEVSVKKKLNEKKVERSPKQRTGQHRFGKLSAFCIWSYFYDYKIL